MLDEYTERKKHWEYKEEYKRRENIKKGRGRGLGGREGNKSLILSNVDGHYLIH